MVRLSLAAWPNAEKIQRETAAETLHRAFRSQEPLELVDLEGLGMPESALQRNLGIAADALRRLEVDVGFAGIDGKQVKRRSCAWVNAWDHPELDEDYVRSQLHATDGDPESLRKGLALFEQDAALFAAVQANNLLMNGVIRVVMELLQYQLGIPEAYFQQDVLLGSTYRQRLVYYDASLGDSQCGVHPDGNLLSFLITDTPGFRYFDASGNVREPAPRGILCAAGSLLWRWTDGLYPPLFHYVKRMSQASKTSIVYFYNLQDRQTFPLLPWGTPGRYCNDIRRYKPEDVDPEGPFGAYFSRLASRAVYD